MKSDFPNWAGFTPEFAEAELPRLLAAAEKAVAAIESLTSGEDAASPLGLRASEAVEKRLGVVAKCVSEIRGAL